MSSTSAPPAHAHRPHGRALRADALGTSDTIVMAVAGSAPAYTLAATTAVLIGTTGLFSPAALLWCAIPMLGIAWAFKHLGKLDVNAGASYSWVGRALHPSLGFLSGWALVVSATIFMVAGALPAGSYTLSLFSASAAGNTWAATGVGAFWFLLMALLVLAGIRITAHAQWIMSGIEVLILVAFGVSALVHASGHHPAALFSWSWFWGFGHFGGPSGFASAALVAAFYFWGWDVTANLSEETSNSRRNSGLGGLIGVVTVFVLFEVVTIAVNLILTQKQIQAHGDDLLSVLGDTVWPGWGGKVLVLAVMLSTIATLETTLIQVTRSLFAMGRDRTVSPVFGRSHPRWQTPHIAVGAVTVVSLVLLVASNGLGSVSTILSDAVSAIGLQIAFYYSLAGFAVVAAYRRLLFKSFSNAFLIGLWPLVGALFMLWILIQSLTTLSAEVIGIGMGTLALGLVPMAWFWAKGSGYYRPARLDAATAAALAAEYGEEPQLVAPEAGGHDTLPTDM
jgi:amino acid transporter